jgi:RNA polymerase sigma-70 factor (ECF subfamily)
MRPPSLPVLLVVPDGDPDEDAHAATEAHVRLRTLFEEHYEFVWRTLRRLGLPPSEADDGAQRVWLVAARRLANVRAGSERGFLFTTALHVAAAIRRSVARRPDQLVAEAPEEPIDPQPLADLALDERRARALLDDVLDAMPIELRAVFVLYELEEMSCPEIAALLELPLGTATSRLRRARAEFEAILKHLRARGVLPGGER